MNELIKVNYESDNPTVSGRELHERLAVDTPYTKWFLRMCEYGFDEGKDYWTILSDRSDGLPGKPRTDHALTIPMAKEIAMLQRNAAGKEIRQYLIKMEEAWNAPEVVMSRALRMADVRIKTLQADNSKLVVANTIMAPKAEYFDDLVDRHGLLSFRETAKELKIGERIFTRDLVERKYVFRDKKGKLMPYAQYCNTADKPLFEVKECFNEKTDWSGSQTLITPRGREHFRRLYAG